MEFNKVYANKEILIDLQQEFNKFKELTTNRFANIEHQEKFESHFVIDENILKWHIMNAQKANNNNNIDGSNIESNKDLNMVRDGTKYSQDEISRIKEEIEEIRQACINFDNRFQKMKYSEFKQQVQQLEELVNKKADKDSFEDLVVKVDTLQILANRSDN